MKGRDIIELFEDSKIILEYKSGLRDAPLWLFVRHFFLNDYNTRINNLTNPFPKKKIRLSRLIGNLFHTIKKNPYRLNSKEVLFFNSGITNVKTKDGKYFNRITDYFYFQIPKQAALVEDPHNFEIIGPRIHSDVYTSMPFILRKKAGALLSKRIGLDSSACKEVSGLVSYLRSVDTNMLEEEFWIQTAEAFTNILSGVREEYGMYYSFLRKVFPKLIFIEDASYGTKLPLLLAAKDLGISVGELQHGIINKHHLAYNFGTGVMKHSLLKRSLPDYFLTYSSYWSNQINLPVGKVGIGNPFLVETCKQYVYRSNQQKLLILSSGTSRDELCVFGKHLLQNPYLKDFDICLRPHPGEKADVHGRYGEVIKLGIQIDLTDNLYQSLSETTIVIGEFSTALYEASVFPITSYLLATSYSNAYVSNSPFPIIEINEEVSVRDFRALQNSSSVNLWAEDWEKNFQQFLSNFIDV